VDNIAFTKDEILNLAKEQNTLCWIFFGLIASYVLIMVYIGIITIFILSIWAIFKVYHLAKALKKENPGLYAFGMFIPIIKLIVLLTVIQNTTKILRANNISVGLMGANKQSIEIFKNA